MNALPFVRSWLTDNWSCAYNLTQRPERARLSTITYSQITAFYWMVSM